MASSRLLKEIEPTAARFSFKASSPSSGVLQNDGFIILRTPDCIDNFFSERGVVAAFLRHGAVPSFDFSGFPAKGNSISWKMLDVGFRFSPRILGASSPVGCVFKKIGPTAARFPRKLLVLALQGVDFRLVSENNRLGNTSRRKRNPGNYKGNQTAVGLIFSKIPQEPA